MGMFSELNFNNRVDRYEIKNRRSIYVIKILKKARLSRNKILKE